MTVAIFMVMVFLQVVGKVLNETVSDVNFVGLIDAQQWAFGVLVGDTACFVDFV